VHDKNGPSAFFVDQSFRKLCFANALMFFKLRAAAVFVAAVTLFSAAANSASLMKSVLAVRVAPSKRLVKASSASSPLSATYAMIWVTSS
jgi:hypothetical protein